MIHYIGMDAHSSSCTFCITDALGREIETVTLQTNGKIIKNYLRSFKGHKQLTFEECELSRWLFGIINQEVDKLIICNPVANKEYKKAKTDKLDARKLAKLLRGGFLTPVFHDGSERERFRNLMSSYQDVVDEGVRLKNRYKSLFRKNGQRKRGVTLYNDESLLEGLPRGEDRFIGSHLYRLLTVIEESRNAYVKEITLYSNKFKELKLLTSIPCIGIIQAAKIVSQVVNPNRFATKYKYYSYCGLVRHTRTSADRNYGTAKIWGNRVLKCVYKMAGHAVLNGNSQLRVYYDDLRQRGISHDNAYNAVCRKIAAISLSLWKHNKRYNEKMVRAI
ncbi:MAG: transposase [Candidatus Saccharimonadaceae bacterium]|nr:transposase [Candidatus Saccharimonadaceae bacterium]